jgi:hypothetical protein
VQAGLLLTDPQRKNLPEAVAKLEEYLEETF